MKKIILIFIISLSIIFTVLTWSECTRFAEKYYFSPFDLQLRLIEFIHNDQGSDPLITRAFHNKGIGSILDISRMYLKYFDGVFLISLLGFAGIFSILIGLFDIIQKKKLTLIVIASILLMLLLPLVEILFKPNLPFFLKVLMLIIPYSTFLYFGIIKMVKHHFILYVIVVCILASLTIWWNSVYSPIILEYCVI